MLKSFLSVVAVLAIAVLVVNAKTANFRGAPDSAKQLANPYEGSADAAKAGKPLYHLRCARCHGERGEGSGNIPRLKDQTIKTTTPGEIFWFITKGDPKNEMPSWASLPKDQRWKIITYLKSMNLANLPAPAAEPSTRVGKLNLPLPKAPFTDFRERLSASPS